MKRHPLIVIGLTLALTACVTVERDSAGSDAPPCEEGTKRCNNDLAPSELQHCDAGRWRAAQICGDDEVCVGEGEKCRAAVGQATCPEVVACANATNCGDDATCYQDCFYDGSQDAQARYFAFVDCVDRQQCDFEGELDHYQFASCLIAKDCDGEASDCLIGAKGTDSCGEMVDCAARCAMSHPAGSTERDACVRGCLEAGSATGQTWFFMLQLCVQDHCDGDLFTCVAQGLEVPTNPCAAFIEKCPLSVRPDVGPPPGG